MPDFRAAQFQPQMARQRPDGDVARPINRKTKRIKAGNRAHRNNVSLLTFDHRRQNGTQHMDRCCDVHLDHFDNLLRASAQKFFRRSMRRSRTVDQHVDVAIRQCFMELVGLTHVHRSRFVKPDPRVRLSPLTNRFAATAQGADYMPSEPDGALTGQVSRRPNDTRRHRYFPSAACFRDPVADLSIGQPHGTQHRI